MNIKDLKILICDDSVLARRQLKNFLEEMGCNTFFEAANGLDAVNMYKNHNPDIVFLDIVMPEKNGIDTTKEIMEYNQTAYIVMASSVGTQSNLKEALKLGAKDFIQKPLNADQIHKVIHTVLEGGC